jgi:endogenous inhibitor of DNA gyrase (YacG/DUF329 family)
MSFYSYSLEITEGQGFDFLMRDGMRVWCPYATPLFKTDVVANTTEQMRPFCGSWCAQFTVKQYFNESSVVGAAPIPDQTFNGLRYEHVIATCENRYVTEVYEGTKADCPDHILDAFNTQCNKIHPDQPKSQEEEWNEPDADEPAVASDTSH